MFSAAWKMLKDTVLAFIDDASVGMPLRMRSPSS
jgi:hypothetical protein